MARALSIPSHRHPPASQHRPPNISPAESAAGQLAAPEAKVDLPLGSTDADAAEFPLHTAPVKPAASEEDPVESSEEDPAEASPGTLKEDPEPEDGADIPEQPAAPESAVQGGVVTDGAADFLDGW